MLNAIQSINQSFIVGVLGSGLGNPVAALMGTMQGGQLGQLGNLLKGLQGLFGKSAGMPGSAVPQRPLPFSGANININISINPLGALQQPTGGGPLQSFGKVPEVGSESQWKGFADAANSRITGSDAAKKGVEFDGTNPWSKGGDKTDMAAVGWALQKNDNLRYNADSKQFYVTNADGSTRNVASLDEVKQQITNAGGASSSNGAAYNAVGAFLDGRVGNAQSSSSAAQQKASGFQNPFQQLVEMLQKLVQKLTQGGAAGAASGSGAVGAPSGGGGVGAPAGGGAGAPAGGASGAAPTGGGASGGSGISSMDSMVSKAGGNIDSMMAQAEQLMASDKPSDQLKGQMMMQRAMRMFEMISKMLEQRSQAQAKAIQAIK